MFKHAFALTVPAFYQTVRDELEDFPIEVVFINDGSADETPQAIQAISEQVASHDA